MELDYFLLVLMCSGCISLAAQSPVSENVRGANTSYDSPELLSLHHNYESMVEYLRRMHERYPKITCLYTIGKSVEGRELYVMEITSNPGRHDVNKPEVKYIGNIHGNEVTGREMLLHLIDLLCRQYEIDRRITNIVNSVRLHILPSMNPDGYEIAHQLAKKYPHFDSLLYSRNNSENVDLNRNFPGPQNECMSIFDREPETQAVMKWTARIPFVSSLDLHSGAVAMIHPFGFKSEHTPDHEVFQALASTIFENNRLMRETACKAMDCDQESVTATANDFYGGRRLLGDMQDYDYLCSNCLMISVEMNVMKYPKASELADLWQQNRDWLLAFIERSRGGIHGFVRSSSGSPIVNASITIEGNANAIVTAQDGDYWRLMVPGDYRVTASCNGYEPVTKFAHVPFQNESTSETIILNFTLTRVSDFSWTSNYDFGIQSNMNRRYLKDSELYSEFDRLIKFHPRNFLRFDNNKQFFDGRFIREWQITGNINLSPEDKFHIALIGGLYESQPIGREIIIRLVSHLLAGLVHNDSQITKFLDAVVLHVILGSDPDSKSVTYRCDASKSDKIGEQLLNRTDSSNTNSIITEFRDILKHARYDAVIPIVGGGLGAAHTDEFFEIFKDISAEYDRSMPTSSCRKTTIENGIGNFIYKNYGFPGITLAVSCCNSPSADSIPIIWRDNLMPLKRILFRLAHGVILRVYDERGNIVEGSQIHFSRDAWKVPIHSMAQESKVIRKILPLGSVAIQVSHSGSMSNFILKESDIQILHKNMTVLKF